MLTTHAPHETQVKSSLFNGSLKVVPLTWSLEDSVGVKLNLRVKEFQSNKTLEIDKKSFYIWWCHHINVFGNTSFWVRLGRRFWVEARQVFVLGVSTARNNSAYPIRLRISLGPVQWDNTSKVQNTAAYRPIRDHTKFNFVTIS